MRQVTVGGGVMQSVQLFSTAIYILEKMRQKCEGLRKFRHD